MIEEKINKLKNMINAANNIVFFTGAGVSTESGIPDFRSKDGLYNKKNDYKIPPEYLLSNRCFYENTNVFFDNYRKNMNCLKYEPNITHKYIKKLEDDGKVKAVITQNIDNLHTKAGSKIVYELHGNINRNYCIKCNKFYDAKSIFNNNGIPKCNCGGIIKPDVVLYGEQLLEDAYFGSIRAVKEADLLIVAGTSLTVYPASGLVDMFDGDLVIINKDETPYDYKAKLVINESLKDVFDTLKKNY